MKKSILLSLIFTFLSIGTQAQVPFFTEISSKNLKTTSSPHIKAQRNFDLDYKALKSSIFSANQRKETINIELPLARGGSDIFVMTNSSVFSEENQKKFPQTRTYSGVGKTGKIVSVTFFENEIFVFIDDGYTNSHEYIERNKVDGTYRSYSTLDVVPLKKTEQGKCGQIESSTEDGSSMLERKEMKDLTANGLFAYIGNYEIGKKAKKYKIAISTTAEFTMNVGNNDQDAALNEVVKRITVANTIYNKFLKVTFELVSDKRSIFTDPATDGLTNGDDTKLLSENQKVLDDTYTPSAYDVGHVFSTIVPYQGNSSGGGVAVFQALGQRYQKGMGMSGFDKASTYFPQVFIDQLFLHELGHQMGMNHTFNSNIPVCTTRNPATSVEVGSGETIMSYGYTCSDQNDATKNDDYAALGGTEGPKLNFHVVSIIQSNSYINGIAMDVGTTTDNYPKTTASIKSFSANNRTIPKSTPFELKVVCQNLSQEGARLSSNTSNLTDMFSIIEGVNIGDATTAPDPSVFLDDTKGPFFRSYDYKNLMEQTRTFPTLSAILDGTNATRGEKLPSVSTPLGFQAVCINSGSLHTKEIKLTVDDSGGPFLETTNLSGTYKYGSKQTITWSVNNTDQAPFNVSHIDILLSLDGGQTFPTVLVSNTPNDGSEEITFPSAPASSSRNSKIANTTTARIKIQASNSLTNASPILDISNVNFKLEGTVLPLTLLSFSGESTPNGNILNWSTSDETNVELFLIEKSANQKEFQTIGKINASNLDGINNYSFRDPNPTESINYYRLKINDLDGSFSYSNIVSLNNDENLVSLSKIYPNPTDGKVNLDIFSKEDSEWNFNIYSESGKLLDSFNKSLTKGKNSIGITLKNKTTNNQIIQITDGKSIVYKRVLIKQ